MSPYEAVFGQKARSQVKTETGPGLFFCEDDLTDILKISKRFVISFILKITLGCHCLTN